MIAELLPAIWPALIGMLLIVCGLYAFRLGRTLQHRSFKKQLDRLTPKPVPAEVEPVDAVAEMLEAKAAIRKDEIRRWAEAWQRAAGLPDFWATVEEIRQVEYRAVRDDRERRQAAAEHRRRLEIEERQAERTARAEQERAAEAAARAAEAAHQAHLAERRARYAQRRRSA